MRVAVKPQLLRWARERAGLDAASLARRFPRLAAWEAGDARPTPEPPVEAVPIPDFRTVADRGVDRPSPDLLDTLYPCQQRQEWYREFAVSEREPKLSFVGSLTLQSPINEAAVRMARDLNFGVEERRQAPTWTEALRRFIARADEAGILVMVNGVVGNNNRRKLSPQEFRGFALSDSRAPLVFINGADSKSAQMFTLAHELAHVWLGVTLKPGVPFHDEAQRLARFFKVSTIVVLRRLRDMGVLAEDAFWAAYRGEIDRLGAIERGGGGDFYLTQAARVSKRFARSLVVSTLEGRTLYTEAFRLLGFSKLVTFRELGHSLGVA